MDEEKMKAMKIFMDFKKERVAVIDSKMESLAKSIGEVEPTPIQDLQDLEQAKFQLGNVHNAFRMWIMEEGYQGPTFRFDEKKWDKL
jgi:hypothetical protein